ncbi:MAG: GntR family transcriptional regulator [Acidobacteria bacterium]|nr:GntR family transcriptional regulator [Acidobacteriota bacterium]
MTNRRQPRRSNAYADRASGAGTAGATKDRLVDLAYARIKREIIRCVLKPGALVTEQYLSSTYELGKGPVRAALVRLGHERLVRSVPRRGYEVAPITLRDVQELMDFRMLLESFTASRAAGRVDADLLTRIDARCRAGYRPGHTASEETLIRANREVHLAIARAAGNQRIANALAGVFDAMERVFYLGLSARDRSEEMSTGHAEFIEALASGNRELAERLAVEEVEESRQIVVDSLLRTSELLDATISAMGAPAAPAVARRFGRRHDKRRGAARAS